MRCPICRDRDCPGCDWDDEEIVVDDEPTEVDDANLDDASDRAADAWERWREERYA